MSFTTRHKADIALVIIFACLMVSGNPARAYTFEPTEIEFNAWPSYCKSRYATTDIGQRQPFTTNYSKLAITQSIQAIGQSTFEYIHHYCAGLVLLNRSKFSTSTDKASTLSDAFQEVNFTLQRIPETSPLYSSVLAAIARIQQELKKFDSAKQYLDRAIAIAPDEPAAYILLALLYREQGNQQQALQTLEQGNTVTDGMSADIHYNLGLIELEIGKVESAAKHAKAAYDLGYPLSGLKNKLMAKNAWPPVSN